MTIDKVRRIAIGRHLYINGEDAGTVESVVASYGYEIRTRKGDVSRTVMMTYNTAQMAKLCAGGAIRRQKRSSCDGEAQVFELKGGVE